MSEYDQYKSLCANCDCMLTEDVSIECISRGDVEQTWCMECWQDVKDEMRKEGWVGQGDEDEDETSGEMCGVCEQWYPHADFGKGIIMGECGGCMLDYVCGHCSVYNDEKGLQLCLECNDAVTHECRSCGETMSHERFEKGKMCCDKPLFGDDESESEDDESESEDDESESEEE